MRYAASWVLAVLVSILPCWSGGDAAAQKPHAYGKPVAAPAGVTVRFPEFSLKYLGKKGTSPPAPPVVSWDFELEGAAEKKVITVASVGVIAPHPFCYDGRAFYLERDVSTFTGEDRHLGPDDIVIWEAPKESKIDCRTPLNPWHLSPPPQLAVQGDPGAHFPSNPYR